MFRKTATTAVTMALGGTAGVLGTGTAAAELVAGCPPHRGELATVEQIQQAQSVRLIEIVGGNLDDRNGDGYLCGVVLPEREPCIALPCPPTRVIILDNNVPAPK